MRSAANLVEVSTRPIGRRLLCLWRLNLPPADYEKRSPKNGADDHPEAMKTKIDSVGDFCANERPRDAEQEVRRF